MKLSNRAALMPASPIRRLARLAEEAKARGIEVLHLNIGQPDIETPKEILEAISKGAGPVLEYGPSAGLWVAREAVAGYLSRLGPPVAPEEVLITTGGSEAILFALMAVCDPGDEVLVFEPFYTNYAGFACMASVRLRPLPSLPQTGYHLPDMATIEAAITDSTKAILYCSPANPTGAVLRKDEVQGLLKLAQKHDLFVIADEVYREFVYDGEGHYGILQAALDLEAQEGRQFRDRVILVDSISKRFSACGARVGALVTHNQDVLDACLRFGQARLCPPTLEQYGAAAGYKVIGDYVPKMIDEYRRRRDCVMEGLARIPGVQCVRPEGAFYVMPCLPIDDSNAFATFLLTEFSYDGKTVMVAPGDGFYVTQGAGKKEVRIAYVLKEERLEVAMDLLSKGLEAYLARSKGWGV